MKKQFIVRCGVACVMAIWAVCQLWFVQTQRLSSWRGGGFGMYAGFHPVQRDAWLEVPGESPVHFQKHIDSDHVLYATVRPHLTYPRPAMLQEAIDRYSQEIGKPITVEIFVLSLDLETRQLSQESLVRVTTEDMEEEG